MASATQYDGPVMSEYSEVEQPFLQQLAAQGWTVIDQGTSVPQDAALSLRESLLVRLGEVRRISHDFGYGVGDDMDHLLLEYGVAP
jgi:hypothetical protein